MEHKFIRKNPDGSEQEIIFDVKHDPSTDKLSLFIFDGDQGTAIDMPRSEFISLNNLVHLTVKLNTTPSIITPGTLTSFRGTTVPVGWRLFQDLGKNEKILEYVGTEEETEKD